MGRQPDVLVPSDRDIPRAVNEGNPIVLAKPQSEAAEAFRKLAGLVMEGEPADARYRRAPQAVQEGVMDLHERLSPTRPLPTVSPTGAAPDPFAELKNAVHLR